MKNQVAIIAAVLILCSCKKFKEPTPLTIEEINEKYKIKYGRVAFYSSNNSLFTQITNGSDEVKGGRGVSADSSCSTIFDSQKYTLIPGIQSYSTFTTKLTSDYRLVPDKLIKTGSIDVAENSCNVIKLD